MSRLRFSILCLALQGLATPTARAYKTSLKAVHFGSSLSGAYASQISAHNGGWDVLPQLIATGDTYTNDNKHKTPLRVGFFYRHPNFTLDTYIRYFTNYGSDWKLSGSQTGAGTSKYRGTGLGVDFQMPMLNANMIRAGLVINAEYLRNKVMISFLPDSGTAQKLAATSNNAVFGGGLYGEAYLGDMWSISLNALYAYDLGGSWNAGASSVFLGETHAAGRPILDSDGKEALSAFSHWRVEAILRLAFY